MQNSPLQAPSVYQYNNFRIYLSDLFDFRQQEKVLFTKAWVCRALGLPNSRSYFQDILNGKFLSDAKVPLFIKTFRLSRDEGTYFRILVDYNQSTDADDREILLDQLIALNRIPREIVPRNVYEYYRTWHHSIVRALLETVDVTEDPGPLVERSLLPLSRREATESLKLLGELGLIAPDAKGSLRPAGKIIATGTCMDDEVIRRFQAVAVEKAREIISTNTEIPQKVVTKVISLSEEAYGLLEKRVSRFSAEVNAIIHKDEKPADRVYHLDLLLYPVSQKGTP